MATCNPYGKLTHLPKDDTILIHNGTLIQYDHFKPRSYKPKKNEIAFLGHEYGTMDDFLHTHPEDRDILLGRYGWKIYKVI